MPANTSAEQDRVIEAARNQEEYVGQLIDIIEDLDVKVEEANATIELRDDTINELKNEKSALEREIESLKDV